jgi:cobalt-zinc-cadmium efflux system outer membrane protein
MKKRKHRLRLSYQATCVALATAVLLAPSTVAAETPTVPAAPSQPQPQLSAGVIVSPPIVKSFSLSTCFDKADDNNKDIVVARRNLPIAQAGVRIAGALPNPQIQLQTGFGNSFTFLFTGQTQQLFFTQQMQTAGKRSKKIAVARENYEVTELQLAALRFDVHNRVRRAYAELAAAEAYEALIEAQRDVGLKLLRIAQARFEAGKAAKSEMMQANLNVLQFDTQRNQAQGRLQQASANLALVMGVRPEHIEVFDVDDNGLFKLSAEKTEIVPSPALLLPGVEKLLATAFSARLDLKTAEEKIMMNRKALALARAQRIPDVFVGSGFTYSTFAKNQPVGLTAVSNYLGEGAFFTMSMEAPFFYQHQGEVQQAVGNLRQSERQVDLLKSQIAANTVTAYNAMEVARANIFDFQNELLPTAAEVARLARRGYQVGATDLSIAIVAQQQYQQTLSSYFDTVVAYQNAWADLEKAVGLPLQK